MQNFCIITLNIKTYVPDTLLARIAQAAQKVAEVEIVSECVETIVSTASGRIYVVGDGHDCKTAQR